MHTLMISKLHGSMVDRIRILAMMVLTVIPLGLSAQEITPEEFMSVIQEKQNRINLIRKGIKDARTYFELDNLEDIAYESPDPQAYLDFCLARFSRTLSLMNYAGAEIAQEIAEYIHTCPSDGTIDPVVIEEGYAKYSRMRDFFLEYADESFADYQRLWLRYSEKYGDNGIEMFLLDDAFMSRYGVGNSD